MCHFLHRVWRVRDILGLCGPGCQIGGVVADVLMFQRPLQGAADNRMVLDHGIGIQPATDFELLIVLQVSGGYASQGDPPGIEVGNQVKIQNVHILIVGCYRQLWPVVF